MTDHTVTGMLISLYIPANTTRENKITLLMHTLNEFSAKKIFFVISLTHGLIQRVWKP